MKGGEESSAPGSLVAWIDTLGTWVNAPCASTAPEFFAIQPPFDLFRQPPQKRSAYVRITLPGCVHERLRGKSPLWGNSQPGIWSTSLVGWGLDMPPPPPFFFFCFVSVFAALLSMTLRDRLYPILK
eukprot:RCo043499